MTEYEKDRSVTYVIPLFVIVIIEIFEILFVIFKRLIVEGFASEVVHCTRYNL